MSNNYLIAAAERDAEKAKQRVADLQAQVERLTEERIILAEEAAKAVERLAQERDETHRQIAVVVEAGEALSRSQDWILAGFPCREDYEKADQAIKAWIKILADLPAAAKRYTERAEKLAEWAPILEAAQRQDIKWKKPMPTDIDFGDNSVYVWALKAQEELGELSAALLGGLIDKEGRGDALEECYQLIAVLLRVAAALREMEGK